MVSRPANKRFSVAAGIQSVPYVPRQHVELVPIRSHGSSRPPLIIGWMELLLKIGVGAVQVPLVGLAEQFRQGPVID